MKLTMDVCPNCRRDFYAHRSGAYCPECWSAWVRNDGSYESRTVTAADYVARLAGRSALTQEGER